MIFFLDCPFAIMFYIPCCANFFFSLRWEIFHIKTDFSTSHRRRSKKKKYGNGMRNCLIFSSYFMRNAFFYQTFAGWECKKRKTEEEIKLLRDFYFLIENNGNGEEKKRNSKVINFRIDSVLFIWTISQELQKHFFILLSLKNMFPFLFVPFLIATLWKN